MADIQLFTTSKSQDGRKAERWFKERGVRFQRIDLTQKGLSRGELASVAQAAGGLDALLDENCRDRDALALVRWTAQSQKADALLERQQVLKLPIARFGRRATVGYCPEVWKAWLEETKG